MIPVFSPWIDEDDVEQITQTLRAGDISGTSPVVQEFENAVSDLSGKQYSVAVANGSVALDLALLACNLEPGSEVIMPSFTIVSCLAAVIRCGAVPVFVDADESTWNIDLDLVQKAITPKTRAIMAVHIYGLPVQIARLQEICRENSLILIEDAAEAHGQIVDGRKCGSFGDVSTFSFYANKHVTTGEGGAVCTDNPEIANRVKQLRNLSFNTAKRFSHDELSWNYRIGGLAASLGISQLRKLDQTISNKIGQGEKYRQMLGNRPEFSLQPTEHMGSKNHYWVFGVLFDTSSRKDQVVKVLSNAEIETRPFFWGLHEQPLLTKYSYRVASKMPVTEKLSRNGIYLPLGRHLTDENLSDISKLILRTVELGS